MNEEFAVRSNKIIKGGHELAGHLRVDYHPEHEEWPSEEEIAGLDTDDPIKMMVSACRLNGKYKGGDHASAIIAGFVHIECCEPMIQPEHRGQSFLFDTPELLACHVEVRSRVKGH